MARFKKGSKQAKAWGAKMRRLRKASPTGNFNSVTKLKNNRTMTKRRYTRTTKRRTTKKRTTSILGVNVGKATSAMMYGAMRARTSQMLSPYTSKLPLGNIADEVGMIGLAWAGKKYLFKGSGVLRDALTIGQSIELARIGDAVISGQVGIPFLNMGSSSPATNGNIF